MNNITIVTGFFDCNRGQDIYQKRTNDKYFEYFEFWARIQNEVVIFGNESTVKRALDIRRKYGREDQTKTVIIDDITKIEPEIYKKMVDIENLKQFRNWRMRDKDVSNQGKYNYVTFMKYWMILEASKHVSSDKMLSWVDFGFNHGGSFYNNPKEFDFLWKYNFNHDKVHFFTISDNHDNLGFIKLMMMKDWISGMIFLCPSSKSESLYNLMKQCVLSLLAIDVIDDDQMLMSMGYKLNPELFEVHMSGWFLPMKQYGGEHLSYNKKRNEESFLKKITKRNLFYIFKYIYAKLFYNLSVAEYEYIRRLISILRQNR